RSRRLHRIARTAASSDKPPIHRNAPCSPKAVLNGVSAGGCRNWPRNRHPIATPTALALAEGGTAPITAVVISGVLKPLPTPTSPAQAASSQTLSVDAKPALP